MRLSVLLPIYDMSPAQACLTQSVIRSLLQATRDDPETEIVIIDDASPCQDTIEYVGDLELPQLKIVAHTSNEGLVKSLNHGAVLAEGDALMYCHSDCLCDLPTLTGIRRCLYCHPDAQVVVSILSDSSGSLLQAGGLVDRNLDLYWNVVDINRDTAVHWGDVWTARRDFFEDSGGLDEQYGIGYMECVDLGLRSIMAGCPVIAAHDSRVLHYKHQTFHARYTTDERLSLMASNLEKLKRKWWTYRHQIAAASRLVPQETAKLQLPPEIV